jgi:ornithine cyclodeaminase/alanine dehydrogenase-like protein (mu-crystallin family)
LQGLDEVEAVSIGSVLQGVHPGRTGSGITVFDSTGIALQDLTTAWRAYTMALELGLGVQLAW